MLVYQGNVRQFNEDVINNVIADKIKDEFLKHNIINNNESEYRSWENSLRCMQLIVGNNAIDEECKLAIEYRIPLTSKRVDFILTGKDEKDINQVIIVELKQWEKAKKTDMEDLVITHINGRERPVTHPSYQSYSYAKVIESFNEYISRDNINLHPCAFLHNYKEEYRAELENDRYTKTIDLSPIFLKNDYPKLRNFIQKYIKKHDNGEILYKIENGKLRPSKSLQDALSSMIKGNKEFYMIDEQQVAFEIIKKVVRNSLISKEKSTIIVQGGPGTGKSVIAINLLAEFKNIVASYVTKNAAPREVYFSKLRKDKFKYNYVSNLFKGSGAFVDAGENIFDCLIVDEAHRLNEKSMMGFKGENQIKEIINASKVSIFFVDEDQKVTTKDIGSIKEIKRWANKLNTNVIMGDDLILTSQFRCNGSDGYIAFLDNILGIKETANYDLNNIDYDFRIFDNPNKMKEEIKKKNLINNKSRIVAGYCYEWVTKKNNDKDVYDIVIGDDFKAKWNFNTTKTWAIDENSFDQVGCIHTAQGLEFDYVGVIIGKDLRYENGRVITDKNQVARSDKSSGVRTTKDVLLADRIIRNTYKTLMSRGQKGCYIYCEDEKLREYFKSFLK